MMTSTILNAAPDGGDDFRTGEGLRAILTRLHRAGRGAWRADPIVDELMAFTAEKYAGLARKHGLDPWEAAGAAFDVMRTRAARNAADPWAVITHAVRITCIAEQRAQGLLCSTHQARRPQVSRFHDPERFSERENLLLDYHPAFQVLDPNADEHAEQKDTGSVIGVIEDAVTLCTLLGRPRGTVEAAVGHVCDALARLGSRASTYEALRRDRHARALLDVPAASWTALLRILLGSPDAAYAATSRGQGILLRLLTGQSLADLLADDELVATLVLAAPGGLDVRGA
ncbi:hypothetical protein [Bifidobacterium psychraerophilum]|uniref:Serine/arginine repetitive matrix protein 2 n=1 Tax=Bifidobacterium psychraerophilum TaxID=218140 RepID=A0A087CF79_9BIFI|nr:hypothetical protein [Bifidobacterium psychraerophilum]KFI81929.1 hypothetical protein BPSY_0777 [Bifidobacterium psychraerophilum]PKA94735.1 hypothetical protein A9A89_0960 [Bifidobacterium psychraerophilum DSM 22366]